MPLQMGYFSKDGKESTIHVFRYNNTLCGVEQQDGEMLVFTGHGAKPELVTCIHCFEIIGGQQPPLQAEAIPEDVQPKLAAKK